MFLYLLIGCLIIAGYFASAVEVIWFNSCVGPSPRVKISLFLLSTCTDENKNHVVCQHIDIYLDQHS